MRKVALFLLMAIPMSAQTPWSTFLDASRAIDWTSAGFTIPSYTVACSTTVSLTASSPAAASANAASITSALASCDATHNVVNIPAGTYYFTSISYPSHGKQVLRGAGPNSTKIIPTTGVGCAGGAAAGLCMIDGTHLYNGATQVLPGGSNACTWSAGYSQGTTSISLTSCGSAPPLNQTIILDQANDSTDNSGNFICDVNIANCGYESNTGGNNNGRLISGKDHSQQQVTKVTGVTSLGGGAYTVTISPGVYFTNIVSGNAPGAWWPGFVANDGVENLTIDGSAVNSNIDFYDCYQCWVKNVRSLNADRNHVAVYQSMSDVIRDSYFYASQGSGSQSYAVEFDESSAGLVENNIFQQVTLPVIFNAGTGSVIDYNFNTDVFFGTVFGNGAYASHHAGNEMNLFEGNSFFGTWVDDAWGTSDQGTFYRNMLQAWQNGKSSSTFPIMIRSKNRNWNIVGNVMGQPGYHNQYQTVATSTSGGTGASLENTSIYTLGWGGTGAVCSSGFVTTCDPLSVSTLMRWANYDTVTAGTKFDTTEASPAANTFVAANFSSSYFSTLAHTLPASLYYASRPSWWPAAKAWPAIGPDISTGNVGVCSGGTFAGAQATTSAQCTGGGLTTAWASHTVSIPAQDCFLTTLNGPPDGTGSVLPFDASTCFPAVTIANITIAMVGNSTARVSAPGQTRNLSCTTTFSDGTTATCTSPSWTSATPSVATINTSGQVTGVVVGQTLIQATIGTVVSNPVNLVVGSGVIWYIRNDGGTNLQCTGHTDAAYPGSGTGLACGRLSDYYLLNQSTKAWTTAPGDEIDYDNSSFPRGLRHNGVGIAWPFCGTDGVNCFAPPPPDYTAFIGWCARGSNVCPTGTAVGPNPTLALNPTTSWSLINGIGAGLELDFTTGIDIEGIDITQPDTCTMSGITFLTVSNTSMTSGTATYVVSNPSSSLPPVVGEPITITGTTNGGGVFNITNKQIATVTGTGPWTITVTGLSGTVSSAADTGTVVYALTCTSANNYGKSGIQMAFSTNQGPTNLTIKNVAIHGLASRGIIGSHYNKLSTDVLTATNLIVDGNGFVDIDADGGGCADNCNSIGYMNWTNIVTNVAGAVEIHPNGGTYLGNGFTAAVDQQFNGNGDCVVMVATNGRWSWTNLVMKNCTQDGLDSLHTGDGANKPTTIITNIYSEGSEGAAIKLGSGNTSMRNFVAIGNCDNLDNPSSFPGNPPGWNALVGLPCRGQATIVISMSGTNSTDIRSGTIVGKQDINLNIGDIAPTGAGNQCTACTIRLQDIASMGFTSPFARLPAGLFMNSVAGTYTLTADHLSWFNMRSGSWTGSTGSVCPQANVEPTLTTVCTNPQFTAESNVNAMNIVPLGTSPLLLAGVNYTGQPPTDVFGAMYSNPLPIGAAMNSTLPVAATPTASPAAGTYGSTQTVTLSTTTSGATICYTTNGSTPAATTAGTCDGGSTTYSGTISVATTTTIKALATKVGDTNSSVASFLYTIVPVVAAPTASPVAGTYATAQSVALTTSTSGATICFTTDGTTPAATTPGTCSHGTTYSTSISVTTSQTILALGTKSGDTNSSVSSFAYTIAPLPPTSLHILMNMQGMIAQ